MGWGGDGGANSYLSERATIGGEGLNEHGSVASLDKVSIILDVHFYVIFMEQNTPKT